MQLSFRLSVAARLVSLFIWGLLVAQGAAGQGTPIPGLPFWKWQLPQPTGYQFIDAHFFSDSSLLAVGGHATAVRTRNNGRSWQVLPMPAGVDRDLTSVSFADSLNGWIGAETGGTTPLHYKTGPGRMLHTTDGGQTWQVQPTGETQSTHRPRVVAFSSTEALAFSTRQGMEYLSRIQIYVRKPAVPVVRYTTNGGRTWTVRPALPLPGLSPTVGEGVSLIDVAFPNPAAGYVVVANAYNKSRVLRTTDRGLTWQNITPDTLGTFIAGKVQFLDSLNGWVSGARIMNNMLVNGIKLYRTRDGGQSWTPVLSNIDNVYNVHLARFSFADPAHGVAANYYESYVTADSGHTWTPYPYPSALATKADRPILRPSGQGWLLGYGPLARTADYGQTWQPMSRLNQFAECRRVDFSDPTHGWALPYGDILTNMAANGVVLRTADRGAHWQTQDLTALVPGFNVLNANPQTTDGAFPDQDTAWVVGGINDSTSAHRLFVLRTTDGGQSWAQQATPPLPAAAPTWLDGVRIGAWDARRAVVTTGRDGALLVTHDGGQTWTHPAPLTTHALRGAVWADSATVYIPTDSAQLLKSTDAGRTWQILPFGVDVGGGSIFSVNPPHLVFTSAQVGYFVSGDWFVRTTDGGVSWQLQMRFGPVGSRDPNDYSTPNFDELVFVGPRDAFAVNQVDVFRTLDAGLTWTKLAYVTSGAYLSAAGKGRSTRIDRYNAFFTGVGLSRYSEKFIRTDTALARTTFCLSNSADSISVAFALDGTFAPAEQDFRVELSNVKGRFRPAETRLVGQGNASPILARLPASLPAGTYRLRVIRADSSVLGADNGVDLLVSHRPAAVALTPADLVAICAGDSVELTAPAGFGVYQWSTGATTSALWVRDAGTYAVQVGSALDCLSPASDSVRVRIKPVPPMPVITAASQPSGIVVLTSSATTGNQWLLNGQPIAGATGPTYTVSTSAQNGTYTVQVTVGGCVSPLSTAQLVVIAGLTDQAARTGVRIFPNPARERVQVVSTGPAVEAVTLTDLAGRLVARVSGRGRAEVEVALAVIPAGVYLLRAALADGQVQTRRLTVTR